MANYELAQTAQADLEAIALYTIANWGPRQAARYGASFDAHFDAIGNGKAKGRIFLKHRPELRVTHVGHHYVFHLSREGKYPLILAVFHEHMDLMTRLRRRLGD